jgi:hypothetical protein
MLAAIDAVKGIGLVGQSLQIDQAGESAQLAIQGDFRRWLQQFRRPFDLVGRQPGWAIQRQQLAPFRQPEYRHAARLRPLAGFKAQLAARQQQSGGDKPWIETLAQLAGDSLGLGIDPLRFLLDRERLLLQPSRVPVLDLDDAHARRTDSDQVDLVRA